MGDVLAPNDAAYIYRFHEDGAYEIDLICSNMHERLTIFATGFTKKLQTMVILLQL